MKTYVKAIIAVSCTAVAAGGIFGGYHFNEIRKKNKSVADVVPVEYMADSYYGSDIQLEGVVDSGNTQKIMQDESMLIDEILVKEGDEVKKGTPIVKYDMTLLELDVKQKKNALASLEDNIKQMNKEITRLQGLKPSEAMPVIPEPADPYEPFEPDVPLEPDSPSEPSAPETPQFQPVAVIIDTSGAVSGSGTISDPYRFNCSGNTVVTAGFLNFLVQMQYSAEFKVYENNMLSYMWTVDGSKISPSQIADWTLGGNVKTDGAGNVSVDFSKVCFGLFNAFPKSYNNYEDNNYEENTTPPVEDEIDDNTDYEENNENYESNENYGFTQLSYIQSNLRTVSDNYMYSKAEIAKMISEKKSELQKLEIDRKAADITYRKALAKKTDGQTVSNIDGIVTSVNDGTDPEKTDSALIVIQGGQGAVINAYIGELNLDKISVGNTVMVTNYSTGGMNEAVVTSVDTIPVTNYYSWNDNPNSSTYSFMAEVQGDAEGFNVGDWVGVSIPENEEGNTFYIPLHYTREENGRYYVMKSGKDGKLVKQYIKTGKIFYGNEIEVKGGLKKDDKICFPYGKNIKEGIKTRETDEVKW